MSNAGGSRFVAFLGSINVGGHQATKEQLLAVFEALGHERVETFIASGNVIFDAGEPSSPDSIAAAAERTLERALGFATPVYLRTAAEVEVIAEAGPFDAGEIESCGGKPQVMLLRESPSAVDRERALELSTLADRLAFGKRELHWLPEGRMTDSELDLRALAKLIGPSTTRTLNTIQRITTKLLT
ncbi:MAG: DUF1697 domain-containing protein [Thermoleophilia bacterium]|nr:DUF1697 domain-containing protein [Thermoleophilia bacterium]